MTLTPEKLAELREKAKAATSQRWLQTFRYDSHEGSYASTPLTEVYAPGADSDQSGVPYPDTIALTIVPVNAAHIAAADPQTVLALVEEVERLRKENAYWMEECYHQQAKAERLQTDVDRLKADRSIRDSEADGKRIADLVRVQAEKDAEVGRLTRERDEVRAALSAAQGAAAEVDRAGGDAPHAPAIGLAAWIRARSQMPPRTISRRDEFAKAALTGLLASDRDGRLGEGQAAHLAVRFAEATIRALDGAGGA